MSKRDSTRLSNTLLENGYPDFLALNSWQALQPALVPTFKSVSDLARDALEAERHRPASTIGKQDGLFAALLGDPRILYYELMEDPSRFEEGVSDLTQQLVSGARSMQSLAPDEVEMLNRAVIDWTRPRHRSLPSKPSNLESSDSPSAADYLTMEEALADPDVELEYSEDGRHMPIFEDSPGPDIPDEAPPTFWWAK